MAMRGAAGSSFFQSSSIRLVQQQQRQCHRDRSSGKVLPVRRAATIRSSGSSEESVQARDFVAPRPNLEERPPRLCTLRAFSQDGGDSVAMGSAWDSATITSSSAFLKQLAASVQATAQAQDFETLSGRFAMVAFAVALGLEFVTGNNVFKGIEVKELGETLGFSAACVISMAAFSAAWGAKKRIGLYMTKGCQDLVEFILTDTIDAIFYDQDDDPMKL
ncbi:LHC-related protein [Selaginella moellendorffii]|uniref:LHC-related protein n=1 Tax=Selaginella moellendorffii TaxID=88036 RepID=D8RYR6_SELML|nr:stress enhanced protein 2, chloroplastic [Selaginella moellendorffii]XP_024537117.1 stress enhanced protein 2, chloroplastic [Selaginella moellendorffii]EFJ22480.1 LHC-related protein [Selaginella moellendorffii]|eukprot:XP_024537116.1 stress enhanced protein 2, chloroplastic [Selaginella moellendorffii]